MRGAARKVIPLFRPIRLRALHCNQPACRNPVSIVGIPAEPIEPLICWCGIAHARLDGWPFLAAETPRSRRRRPAS